MERVGQARALTLARHTRPTPLTLSDGLLRGPVEASASNLVEVPDNPGCAARIALRLRDYRLQPAPRIPDIYTRANSVRNKRSQATLAGGYQVSDFDH